METFKDFLKHLLQSKTLKNQVTRFNRFNCYCNNTQLCVIFFRGMKIGLLQATSLDKITYDASSVFLLCHRF